LRSKTTKSEESRVTRTKKPGRGEVNLSQREIQMDKAKRVRRALSKSGWGGLKILAIAHEGVWGAFDKTLYRSHSKPEKKIRGGEASGKKQADTEPA